MKGFQDKLARDMVKYIIHFFIVIIFSGCLICKGSGKFKELNDMYFIVDMAWDTFLLTFLNLRGLHD